MADRDRELEMAVHGINLAVAGVEGVRTGLHVCRGHRARQHVAHGGYEPIMGALRKMNVQIFAMEFAASDTGSVEVLKDFPEDKVLGLGVIDVLSDRVDQPEVLIERVGRASKYVDWRSISLNPDCGFAPSSENPIPLREACMKLASVAKAAEMLRIRHR